MTLYWCNNSELKKKKSFIFLYFNPTFKNIYTGLRPHYLWGNTHLPNKIQTRMLWPHSISSSTFLSSLNMAHWHSLVCVLQYKLIKKWQEFLTRSLLHFNSPIQLFLALLGPVAQCPSHQIPLSAALFLITTNWYVFSFLLIHTVSFLYVSFPFLVFFLCLCLALLLDMKCECGLLFMVKFLFVARTSNDECEKRSIGMIFFLKCRILAPILDMKYEFMGLF